MAKPVQQEISKIIGFEPICINSALVSAQNRQRIYWVGKRNLDGTYSRVHVDQPEDRGILLRDVLDGIGAKELSEREMDYMVRSTNGKYSDRWAYLQKPGQSDKALCITANISKGVPYNICAEPVGINTTAGGDKARTLMAGYYKYGTATLLTNPGFTGGTTAVAEPLNTTIDGKAQTIRATIYKDGIRNMIANNVDRRTCVAELIPLAVAIELDENGKPTKAISSADGKTYTVFEVKDGQITIKGKQYPIKLADGFYIIRKLTVSECKRLQTVPEWYEFTVSNSQAYKMLGNGWTVEVIAHLIKATRVAEVFASERD